MLIKVEWFKSSVNQPISGMEKVIKILVIRKIYIKKWYLLSMFHQQTYQFAKHHFGSQRVHHL